MCEKSQRYDAAIKNPREAVQILGISKDATVAQATEKLYPHYYRLNGGTRGNKHTDGRVSAAAHDLIERNQIATWVAQACATVPTTS